MPIRKNLSPQFLGSVPGRLGSSYRDSGLREFEFQVLNFANETTFVSDIMITFVSDITEN